MKPKPDESTLRAIADALDHGVQSFHEAAFDLRDAFDLKATVAPIAAMVTVVLSRHGHDSAGTLRVFSVAGDPRKTTAEALYSAIMKTIPKLGEVVA